MGKTQRTETQAETKNKHPASWYAQHDGGKLIALGDLFKEGRESLSDMIEEAMVDLDIAFRHIYK